MLKKFLPITGAFPLFGLLLLPLSGNLQGQTNIPSSAAFSSQLVTQGPSALTSYWVNLLAKHSGKCLDVYGAYTAPATPTIQWTCNGGQNEEFLFTPVSGGYEITVRHSGLQLDVSGGPQVLTNGAPVIQWPYWGGTNEIWSATVTSDGSLILQPVSSGKCLDVTGISQADGTTVEQWDCNGGDNQKWVVVPVALNAAAATPQASLSTSNLSFGNQNVSTTGSTQSVTLSNSGTAALSISNISISGDFSQSSNCGSSLGAGAACTISVAFGPTASGSRTGTLTVADNAAGAPHTVSLSGTGVVPAINSNISGIWANEGGDKVSQDELRATTHKENLTGTVINRAWNGTTISVFGARNEVVSFNLILEAAYANANNVTVTFNTLTGPGGTTIYSAPASGNGVLNWVGRPIELFYTRYLQIKGLSFFGYDKFDERQIPVRFQRPWTGSGTGSGGWTNRPDHDKFYPDPLVPLELVNSFQIPAGTNESIWSDIYIPKGIPAGVYTGNVTIQENGVTTHTVPVSLNVQNFSLPDAPAAKVMANLETTDLMWRYVTGQGGYVNPGSSGGQRVVSITNKYFEMFHRHKIALIGENDCSWADQPCSTSVGRLTGNLFTAANGYDGPGVSTPVGVYSVGTYGSWYWKNGVTQASMWQHADNWVRWFDSNAPGNEFFIYLEDEPPASDYSQVETWAEWLANDPGPGNRLLSLSTHNDVLARNDMPTVSIPVTHAGYGGCNNNAGSCNVTSDSQNAANFYMNTAGRKLWAYSDYRPGTGSSTTEDDGVAMRQIAWAQYKKNISRWYYWDVNQTNPFDYFAQAVTWGSISYTDPSIGQTGSNNTSNGTGVLAYPGTDLYNPGDSYGIDGPIASLRLKEWRRGIQDVDYLSLAASIDPTTTQSIVNRVVPTVLWEFPTQYPTWWVGGTSWSDNPDDWESARAQLAQIITNYCSSHPGGNGCN